VALSVPLCVWVRESVEGATVTDCTPTGVTVMLDVPDAVPLVAVIVAVPTATAVTTPEPDTVATCALLVVHVTGRVTTFPFASVTVAASVPLCPAVRDIADGATCTPRSSIRS
jgi:hypothetical protein